ncbi:MAG: orotidine 5'-phosphate decarboxylase, partial [Alphaproteobacteria bacterium]|nr:orotidine 5'-phosphate decarboxylase [Alphaproteobacteria bacterium]
AALRKQLGKDVTLVVPGIRPAGSATQDQSRVMGPKEAMEAGANWLVIGRPITGAPDPAEAAMKMLASLV